MKLEDMLKNYKEGVLSTAELSEKLQELKKPSLERKPLSEGQKGLWMLEKVAPGMSAYNLPICFRIRGGVRVDLFKQALGHILEQYPILKTVVGEENGTPYQTIQHSQPLWFKLENVSGLDREEVLPFIKKIAAEPFSLQQGPLMRVHMFEGSEDGPIVLINVHHILVDGSSIGILLRSLLDIYLDLIGGISFIKSPLSSSYNDFVEWEQEMLAGPRGEEHLAYWKEQLPGTLPILELPADRPRHEAASFKGATHRVPIPSGLKDRIKDFTRSHRINLPAYFLGMLNIMLHQYSNQEDLIVGMASMGRPSERFDSCMGYFINMIPIRSRIDDNESLLTFMKDVQLTMLDGMDHGDYPFPVLVRDLNLPRNLMVSPVFQVGYFYQNFIQANSLSELNHYRNNLHVELIGELHQEGEYELALEVFEQEDEFLINMKYNPDLYHVSTVRRMTDSLVRLAEEAVKNPMLSIKEYSSLSAEEARTVLFDWNATEEGYPREKCIQDLFQEQVRKTPDAAAVYYENESLSYRELDERSTKLAIFLQKQGVKPDTLVGISVERSLHMIVGVLGILKAGGAYVPLDPEYPTERIQYMIQNSGVSIVLSQSSLLAKMNVLMEDNGHVIPLDAYWETIERTVQEHDELKKEAGPDHLAYVIYTSGSTGNPKGVMIPHSALTNFLLTMGKAPGLTSDDRLLAVTTYSFDIAGLELYLPLIKGAACYICSTAKQKDIEKLKQEIQRIRPTIMQATPAAWTTLFLIGWRNEERVKILCGGEVLPERLKRYFVETGSEVWNMFGPTETTIWSTTKRIEADEPITIGKPIANTQIYILNKHMQPVPIGVPGELYIGGGGLARGYLHLPKMTAERFIDNPFLPGSRIYKTGDSARWLPTGDIEFLGRIDNQVKMHGFRIELDEIETKLNAYPEIKESAVVVVEHNENKQLRAFYVRRGSYKHQSLDIKELRSYLKKCLPAHMIPSVFTELESIPLTPNGKVNRLELSKRKLAQTGKDKTEIIDFETEQAILAIWKDVISAQEIDREDGFFEVGGDSITAAIAAERISRKLDCDVKVTALFEHSNVKDLGKYISELKRRERAEGEDAGEEALRAIDREQPKDQTPAAAAYPDYYEDSVAIIGISCQFPGADNPYEFWQNLRAGRESVRRLSREELIGMNAPEEIMDNPSYVPVQSTIEGKDLFDPTFFRISPKDAEAMDPQMRLLLLHSWRAVEDAGYVSKEIPNTAVYMSSSNNFYQALNDYNPVQILEDSDEYVTWLLGQGGTVPTMISYQLGFKGPSYSVHSNCSSSLVGLYSAFQSLRSGEAEYALVGASTIHSLANAGYVHVPGLNFSSDGHVKAFDAGADGMIGGEGVAVIVLKKAIHAVKDGDHIYGIVRGIQINNDGSDKVGFYAPSIKGQAEVIQKVLEMTGIDPKTIGYVEAHGTGTKLGDPIEVTALSSIYKKYTAKKQFCGIGSVKTNIGHLDTAAGLAGCIKVILSLHNRQIPPTVNFSEANPGIDFENSPFYVVEELFHLEDRAAPYRAALSSFGIGGTNAHVIFESYTETNESAIAAEVGPDGPCIIPLSAKNEERLKEYAADLLRFMKSGQPKQIRLKHVAYTLQVGRDAMDSRVAFVVRDKDELLTKLEAYVGGRARIDQCFENRSKPSMETVQLFDKDDDSNELIRSWINKGKLQKLAMLWVKGLPLDWKLLYRHGDKPRRVSLPTYPFAKEKYWKADAEPRSVGPVTAAKTAAQILHPFIDRNTSDFMEQKYTTAFSGEEFFLSDHVINDKKVLPGVAHIEMGRAAGEMAAKQKIHKIKHIVWSRPIIVDEPREVDIVLYPRGNEIEYKVRTVEGEHKVIHSQGKLEYRNKAAQRNDIEERQETMDIEACKKRCTGFISHGDFYESDASGVYQYGSTFRPIKEMYYNDQEVITRIELPQERESSFPQFGLHPSLLEGCLQTVVGLMKSREVTPFMPFSIEEIEIFHPFPKQCYVNAALADQGSDRADTTKFNMKVYSSEGQLLTAIRNYSIRTITNALDSASSPSQGTAALYYRPKWQRADIGKAAGAPAGAVLLFDDNDGTWNAMTGGTHPIILVKPGQGYKAYPNHTYEIHPAGADDYQNLLLDLKRKNIVPNEIVILWARNTSETEELLERGIYSVYHITQSLMEEYPHERVKLLFVYRHEDRADSAFYGALGGFARTLRLEHPKLHCKVVRLRTDSITPKDILLSEWEAQDGEEICYTDEGRFVKQLQEEDIDQETLNQPVPFRNNGVYLITGGMGGLGLILAKYLAQTLQAGLVLVGRSDLDGGKKAAIAELKALGSEVLYVKADVSVREEAEAVIEQAISRFHALHGIIHCAGTVHDQLIAHKTAEAMKAVLSPKVNGTIHLDEATQEVPLDFFILFSSVSHLGNAGQSDYAYANSFLNGYAEYREKLQTNNRRSGKTVSISWPIWKEGGMRLSREALTLLKSTKGIQPLSAEAGIRVLERSLLQKHNQITVFYGDPVKIRHSNEIAAIKEPKTVAAPAIHAVQETDGDDKAVAEQVQHFLVQTASALVKIQDMDIDRDMGLYGFDSISNTEMANKINERYHLDVMPTVFFELEQPTIRSLAHYLSEKYAKELRSYHQKDITARASVPKSEVRVSAQPAPAAPSFEDADWTGAEEWKLESRFSQFSTSESTAGPFVQGDRDAANDEPIAIIGMNGIFPQSDNLDEFWNHLESGDNLVTEIPEDRFDWKVFDDPHLRWGGFMKEVDTFDAAFFGISDREAEVMDPQHRLFLQVAWSTIEDAGYKPSDLSGSKTGVFVGIGTQDYSQLIDQHMVEHNPYALTGRTPFMLVNRLSSLLNLRGPSEPVDTACSSSLVAVHKAVEAIRSGSCRMAIAGGVNVILTPSVHFYFSAAGMLTDNGKCKVFDKEASGTVRSEGVGAILLKRLSDAITDGDHIYALIRSTAENHKGRSASLTAPSANSQAELLVEVYQKANVDPTTIGYIETHSTGTKLGDPIEITGLKNAFSELYRKKGISEVRPHCAIGSLKTSIGHLEAAAGIGAIIKVLLSMKNEKLLGNIHFKELNSYINLNDSPFYISANSKPWNRMDNHIPRRAGVSAFGFGGVNAHVMIEEFMVEKYAKPRILVTPATPALIVLSANNADRLREQARLLLDAVNRRQFTDGDLASIAYTLQVGREALDERLAFTAVSIDELREKLSAFIHNDSSVGYGSGMHRGRVKKGNDVLALLAEDEGLDDLIEIWIKKGGYSKLLSLWVRGLSMDWNRLHPNIKPMRMPLPTYPFERKRHWIAKQHNLPGKIQEKESIRHFTKADTQAASVKDMILQSVSGLLSMDASELDLNGSLVEWGVDSIILTQLLQQLQIVDPSMDFETLYHCTTINEILGAIVIPEEKSKGDHSAIPEEPQQNRQGIPSSVLLSEYPELIRLNKANHRRPVFWFHGGFGGVEVYRVIAQQIDRPFYGIQARGYMTDHEPIEGIEAMASYYVRMIQSVQSEGPYDLGGLSLGGMIAYEVARQMQEMGQAVNSILMLESIYVNDTMRKDWREIPTFHLKKDRMFRAVNLLLAFSSTEELVLIPDTALNLELDDEAFLEHLVMLAKERGSTRSANQLRKSITQLEKILHTLDMSTTIYEALPMADPGSVQCYYFCNQQGSLFGEDETYFRIVDKGRVYDYRSFSEQWKEKLPGLNTLKVEASNHLTLLTEPQSQEVITAFCRKLYSDEPLSDEYVASLLEQHSVI